ncbi:MAG: HAD family hydrolase [Candidatus Limnocylindria bacterium]
MAQAFRSRRRRHRRGGPAPLAAARARRHRSRERGLTPIRAVVLDDGGVLNDNELRGPEWRRLIAEFFVPRLGGTPGAWSEANRAVIEAWWPRFVAHLATATDGVVAWLRAEDRRWLLDMCARTGVTAPPESEIDDLVQAAHRYVGQRCRSAYPDAVPAIRSLARDGFALHTASGEDAAQLNSYLRGMGVRDLFGHLYGPDRIDRWKNGPAYYAAIVADSGVDPAEAVVVDDSPDALGWAAACGFRPIHLDRARRGSPYERIASLIELADRLA